MANARTNKMWGVALSYISMALSALINLFYTPFMLQKLGQNEYGIYTSSSAIIQYLLILSFGFHSAYIRYYAKYKKAGNDEDIAKLNGLFLILFSAAGLLSLVLGIIMAFNVQWFYNDSYSASDMETAKMLMTVCAFWCAVNFFSCVFSVYITAQEKFIFLKICVIVSNLLSHLTSIVVLILGYGSVAMLLGNLATTTFFTIIYIIFAFRKLKMKFTFGKINWSLLRELAVFCLFALFSDLATQLNHQADKLVLAKMMTAAAVAVYSVALNIYNLYITFGTSVSSVFTPHINLINADTQTSEEEKNTRLCELMSRCGRIQFMLLCLILTGFIFFGQYFISIWAGEEYADSYYLIIIFIVPETLFNIEALGVEILRAKNKHKIYGIVILLSSIANITLGVLLCNVWGIWGVSLGLVLYYIIVITFLNVYLKKKCHISVGSFWLSIMKTLPGFIIPTIVGILILLFVNYSSVWAFLGWMVLYAIVYLLSMYFLGTNSYEKGLLKEICRKFARLFKKKQQVDN